LNLKVRSNLWVYGLTRYWLRGVIIFWLVFASLPWMAPVLMKLGATGPANAIYRMYTPMCHRFPFRSFFLFGEQAAYPLVAAETDLVPFEAYAGRSRLPDEMRAGLLPRPPFGVRTLPEFAVAYAQRVEGEAGTVQAVPIEIPPDLTPRTPEEAVNFARVQLTSSIFIGNEQMGYKTAVCERDLSIYAGLGLAAVIYAIPAVRRKLRPLPIWLYVLVGVLPIGLDGFSQLLSYAPFSLWPTRETTPAFRVLTGLLFGLATGWLGYPNVDLSMRDTRRVIEAKLQAAGIIRK
jgi:uncharacterized membrane protein